jgi:hypothetical protein
VLLHPEALLLRKSVALAGITMAVAEEVFSNHVLRHDQPLDFDASARFQRLHLVHIAPALMLVHTNPVDDVVRQRRDLHS